MALPSHYVSKVIMSKFAYFVNFPFLFFVEIKIVNTGKQRVHRGRVQAGAITHIAA